MRGVVVLNLFFLGEKRKKPWFVGRIEGLGETPKWKMKRGNAKLMIVGLRSANFPTRAVQQMKRYKAVTNDGGNVSTYVRRCSLQQDQWNAFHTWRSLHSSSHSHPFSNSDLIDRTDRASVAPATVRPSGSNMTI
ncbi:hypothetical protein RHMOL_Rhmol10G0041800 [Rhododendron molle]|uniref:Uncharacterized protein n=1 Tax=Rhododendron molle TaxID=49168 RepID=A0ACC0M0H7_RHOML|nr:hypothetical protein RHMOL_Rhmol10G0041800 [Rhododendron molle]